MTFKINSTSPDDFVIVINPPDFGKKVYWISTKNVFTKFEEQAILEKYPTWG